MPDLDLAVTRARKVNDILGEIRVDAYLTNFSVAFRQEASNFVAGFASTPVPVNHESDKFAVYPRGYFWRDEAEVRPLGGRPVQVSYKIESDTYLAEEWALETTVDDRQRRNAAPIINLDENAVRLLEGKQMIREDRKWVELAFNSANWSNAVTGGTDFTQFDDAASEPVAYIDELKNRMLQSTGMMPNTMVVGANVAAKLRSNADIVDRIKYVGRGVADGATLAQLFEVERYGVARAVYNAANEGAADDIDFIANPNSIWLGYIERTPSMDAPTAIARFGWTGLIPGASAPFGGAILRGRDSRARSDWVQSSNAYDYKIVSADLGIYLENAVAPVSG